MNLEFTTHFQIEIPRDVSWRDEGLLLFYIKPGQVFKVSSKFSHLALVLNKSFLRKICIV